MPRDYNNQSPTAFQRRPEHKREDDWIRAYLHKAKVGHIASTWGDQPFLNPSTFWYDEANQRIIFHSNITGRVRANLERNPKVCLEASELGKLLPSNIALEFSLQYRSVMVFGTARILENPEEKRTAILSGNGSREGIPPHHRSRTQTHECICHRDRSLEREGKLER